MHKYNNSKWRVQHSWGKHPYIAQNNQEDTPLKLLVQWALFTTHYHSFNFVTTSEICCFWVELSYQSRKKAVSVMMERRESFCLLVLLDEC